MNVDVWFQCYADMLMSDVDGPIVLKWESRDGGMVGCLGLLEGKE